MLTPYQPQSKTLASPLAKEVITRGRSKLWFMRQVEGYGTIEEPFRRDGWLYIPEEQDMSSIPAKALERVEQIKKWDFRIEGMIVAHEAPMLLAAPPRQPVEIPWKKIGHGFLMGLVAVVASVGLALGMALLMAVQIDPALIVCLEDGSRVEVYRWIE